MWAFQNFSNNRCKFLFGKNTSLWNFGSKEKLNEVEHPVLQKVLESILLYGNFIDIEVSIGFRNHRKRKFTENVQKQGAFLLKVYKIFKKNILN